MAIKFDVAKHQGTVAVIVHVPLLCTSYGGEMGKIDQTLLLNGNSWAKYGFGACCCANIQWKSIRIKKKQIDKHENVDPLLLNRMPC